MFAHLLNLDASRWYCPRFSAMPDSISPQTQIETPSVCAIPESIIEITRFIFLPLSCPLCLLNTQLCLKRPAVSQYRQSLAQSVNAQYLAQSLNI